uniref:CRAL-TRIO domain-containing protein n=1 Tax=Stomoxys calcitrans TaxID=35570 RepID=A0A1I8P6M6_STOCA
MYKSLKDPFVIQHDGFDFKFDFGEPSQFAKDVARTELRETPENVENGLKELRRLLRDEPNLHCPLEHDLWLMSFLRLAHFYPEEALKKYPEICENLNLSAIKEYLEGYHGSMLPQRDQCGRRIYLGLCGKYWNHKKWHRDYSLKSFLMHSEYLRCEPETQICGIHIIVDMDSLTVRQALLITVRYLQCLVELVQSGMGIRIKGFHVLNQPQITNVIYSLAKPFIQEKFVSRIYFHGKDMTSLHRHISPECLPKCYGGTLQEAKQSYGPQVYELFKRYEQDYQQFAQYGYRK